MMTQLIDRRQHVTGGLLPDEQPSLTRPSPDPSLQLVGDIYDSGAEGVSLINDIAGSGPWTWAGSGPLGFLRGGVLITPWMEGTWGVRRNADERAPANAIFADFAGAQHTLKMINPGCLRMRSVRKVDGDVVGIDFAGTAGSPNDVCQIAPE